MNQNPNSVQFYLLKTLKESLLVDFSEVSQIIASDPSDGYRIEVTKKNSTHTSIMFPVRETRDQHLKVLLKMFSAYISAYTMEEPPVKQDEVQVVILIHEHVDGSLRNYLVPFREFGKSLPTIENMREYSYMMENVSGKGNECTQQVYEALFQGIEQRQKWQQWKLDHFIPEGVKVSHVFHV